MHCSKGAAPDYGGAIERRGDSDTIAIAVNAMVHDFQKTVAQARLIADGDYSADIEPKSENDTLGITLAAMTRSLREMSAADERESWLRTGQRAIAEAALGHQSLDELCRDIIVCLCDYLGAQVGALYVRDASDVLRLTGSYAFSRRRHTVTEFKIGDGLVGQVAFERQRILLTDVPDDYIYVTSGLGGTPPKHVLVSPLVMGKELEGVIELGRLEGFTEAHCELVDLVSGNIAIAINMAENVEELERLIAETQRQAHELEEQSVELQATNAELEEKSERLARSHEELQVQSEELRVSNEELEEKTHFLEERRTEIEAKNREIEAARQSLQEKAAALEESGRYKSEFLANMSHELRTPLNSVLILAKMLADDQDDHLAEEERESARVIYESGRDLLRLINDILDLSKVEAGMLELVEETVDVERLCHGLHEQFAPVAQAKGVTFTIERRDGVPAHLVTDQLRTEQILRNLLSNAFKFLNRDTDEDASDGDGSVRMVVHTPDHDMTLEGTTLARADVVAFSVIDSGIGIPHDKQEAIFAAFQQADGSTSRQYGGTGLGLTISRELTRLLGGDLRVESEPGQGATFTLYLPVRPVRAFASATSPQRILADLATPSTAPAAPDPARVGIRSTDRSESDPARSTRTDARTEETPARTGERTILIIEDDPRFADVLMKLARGRGYQCTLARDGSSGLQLALNMRPSAILLDLGLPGLDGLSVLEQLKFHLRTRHIPVHIISARDRDAEVLHMGAIGHLVKPASMDELASVFSRVERYIEKRVKSVLIVEDDRSGRDAIAKLIASDAVDIEFARSGTEAIQTLREREFDCVILDLGLPDTSGFDVLRTLREDRAVQLPPIIVYTGRDLSREEHAALSEYAASIVIKGASSPERLLDEVSLFLHSVETSLPPDQRSVIRDLHDPEQVLRDRTVLLVDDNLRNSFALSGVLRRHGVHVIIADNGKLALEKLEQHDDIDLVIMDIMMPVMDGYEAITKIRDEPRWQSVPIIALTAKAMAEDRSKCLAVGANDYLTKPVDTEQLLALMRVWLFRAE